MPLIRNYLVSIRMKGQKCRDQLPLPLTLNNGGVIMAVAEKRIVWETDMQKALSRAKREKKNVFLDFYNPG